MRESDVKSARAFLRVSVDRSGRERSNEEQDDDNRQTWAWEWADPYRETGSASRYAKKQRDEWRRLIQDLRSGTFGADALVMWESSRGSRKVGEWELLLDLCEQHGVLIAVTTHRRVYDPAVPRDRRSLLEDAVDSDYESGKTSARVGRNRAASAAAGRPHGRRLFGYQRIYDQATRALLQIEPHAEQAPVVRRIFAEYLSGTGPASIAHRLNQDGIRTAPMKDRPNGSLWDQHKVRLILLNPAYAGRRKHQGKVVGQAMWDPLIDPEKFDRAQRRMEQLAEGIRHRQSRTARLLTAVLRCSVCFGHMYYQGARQTKQVKRQVKRNAYYSCYTKGCHKTSRDAVALDKLVRNMVVERLKRPDAIERFGNSEPTAEIIAARQRVAELRALLEEYKALAKAEQLSPIGYAEMEADLLPKIAAAERAAQRALLPLDIDIPLPERVERWWDKELDPSVRRSIVAQLFISIVVKPVGSGKRFDPASVKETWRPLGPEGAAEAA